ncbi:zinc finger protein 236-like isoform X1 [Culex quinquefasciatus]|uniref:zinc finger protein 236-like isoform X1 n=2 Tax=Culex quinquefasciatus TaxID=7176 RepID=UPI0018E3C837|nr:zinc finger protein 236-like isoform X1 [Culex quinquefasciatus]
MVFEMYNSSASGNNGLHDGSAHHFIKKYKIRHPKSMTTEQLPEQYSVFVKEEPREESQIPVFCYEAITKEEVILEDELAENEPSGDERSHGMPAPVGENQFKHFKCSECNKLFKRKKFANTCEKKHEIIRLGLFECKICNKRLSKKQHLANHMESHKRGTVKMFGCNICNRRFCSKQLFEKHEKSQSCGANKMFGCQICKEHFDTQANFYRHMLSHTKEKNATNATNILPAKVAVDNHMFKCPECGKTFDRVNLVRGCLRKHEARQMGYFKCRFCLIHLGTYQYLKKHEARHRFEQNTDNAETDLPTDEQTLPPVINEEEDEAEDCNGELEAESKQFYIIEESSVTASVKEEELQNLPIKTEPDIEQCIPHTVVSVSPQVKKEFSRNWT